MTGRITGIRVVKTYGSGEAVIQSGTVKRIEQCRQSPPAEGNTGRVLMLLDCSGSMAGYKIEQAKRGMVEFAKGVINKEYAVGVVKFNSSAVLICEPKNDIIELEAHLNKLDTHGSTNMAAAIGIARQNLRDVSCRRFMVIATDGRPDNTRSALQAGQAAKDEGIEIIAIGTDDADLAFLQKLATDAELGRKVASEQFSRAIGSASLLLPHPGNTASYTTAFNNTGGSLQYSGLTRMG